MEESTFEQVSNHRFEMLQAMAHDLTHTFSEAEICQHLAHAGRLIHAALKDPRINKPEAMFRLQWEVDIILGSHVTKKNGPW